MDTQVAEDSTGMARDSQQIISLIDKYVLEKQPQWTTESMNFLIPISLRQFLIYFPSQKVLAEINPVIWKRILALKQLCYETIKTESEFHLKVFELERQYLSKFDSITKKRSQVLTTDYVPKEEECKFPGSDEIAESLATTAEVETVSADSKGIPNFWLNVLQNDRELEKLIQKEDEEVLKYLMDIRVNIKDDLSFQLEFHFKPNDYFENSVLTKTYHVKCEPDEQYPFSFDGPEIYKSTGCEIKWKAGKNLTEQNDERSKSALKFFDVPTFFNFFNPPEITPGDSEDNEQIEVINIMSRNDSIAKLQSILCIFRSIWRVISKLDIIWKSESFHALCCSSLGRSNTTNFHSVIMAKIRMTMMEIIQYLKAHELRNIGWIHIFAATDVSAI